MGLKRWGRIDKFHKVRKVHATFWERYKVSKIASIFLVLYFKNTNVQRSWNYTILAPGQFSGKTSIKIGLQVSLSVSGWKTEIDHNAINPPFCCPQRKPQILQNLVIWTHIFTRAETAVLKSRANFSTWNPTVRSGWEQNYSAFCFRMQTVKNKKTIDLDN